MDDIISNNSFIGLTIFNSTGLRNDLDITNSYWGTSSEDAVETIVWDKYDDPGLRAYINYLPILTEPHPDTPTEF